MVYMPFLKFWRRYIMNKIQLQNKCIHSEFCHWNKMADSKYSGPIRTGVTYLGFVFPCHVYTQYQAESGFFWRNRTYFTSAWRVKTSATLIKNNFIVRPRPFWLCPLLYWRCFLISDNYFVTESWCQRFFIISALIYWRGYFNLVLYFHKVWGLARDKEGYPDF